MSAEQGRGSDALGVHVETTLWEKGRNEHGYLFVAKFDAEMSSYVSRKLGGEDVGRDGFIQPTLRDFREYKVQPYEVGQSEHSNLITSAGWDRLLTLGVGGGGTSYASATLRIGVGTATGAAASGNTDLSAATGPTNRFWALVGAAPVVGTGTGVRRLSYSATVGTGDGNFAWQEWGSDQGTTTGTGAVVGALLNRAVSNQSTKVSGQTWTPTAQLDFT